MTTLQAEIPTFTYVSGKEFTEKLRNVTQTTTNYMLADKYGIPRSTIQTWHSHNRTGFELIVRTHLATGASVKYMALGEGEPFEDECPPIDPIKVFEINGGQLEESGSVSLDAGTLSLYGLLNTKTKIVIQDDQRCFINTDDTHPTSGRYLIDIDGSISINQIQRLPGKKLAMSFGESTIDVSENDIKVLGRVAMSMRKE